MTPTRPRQSVQNIEIRFACRPCWLGWALVAATGRGVCAIALGDSAATLASQLQTEFPQAQRCQGDPSFSAWVERVIRLIEIPQPATDLPLDIEGTAFQRRVWQLLQTIPPGVTLSYGEVAEQLGSPKAVRAVARACASNRVAVAIPCHRVVGRDGDLKGYRWGRDRKQALLNREASLTPPPGISRKT